MDTPNDLRQRPASWSARGAVRSPAFSRSHRYGTRSAGLAAQSSGLRARTSGSLYSPVMARLRQQRRPGQVDVVLLLTVVALLAIGLVMVFSASQYTTPGDPGYWLRKQAVWTAIGGAAMLMTANLDYLVWRRWALPGMALTLLLLVIVLIVGKTIYGAQRWLPLGLFSFQPSELAKLMLVIYTSEWLVRKGSAIRSLLYGLIPFGVISGTVILLVWLQNDMGTSIVIAAIAIVLFFAAGASLLQLVPTGVVAVAGALVLATWSSFRRARLDAFLNPLPPGCSQTASYQVCQGLVSLGSGGLFGRGLGDSVAKTGFLPNPFTDSIFAVIGEELGFAGCAIILLLFGVLAFRGLRAGRRAPDAFGALMACGITSWLVIQALVNIGSVIAVTPFTGVPLPFVSFGGSSLVTSLAAVGILLNISRHGKPQDAGQN